jgi:OOP family OmpA-OmpF porin/outer membrane immunogenic protein
MRTLNILGLAVAAALALPTQVLAHTGLYLDGSVGQASVDDGGIDDNDTAFRVGAGWRLWENLGAEIGYQDLGKVGEEVAIGGAAASVEVDGFYAGLSGKIPLYDGDNGFFLGARAGVYFWDATGRLRQGSTSVRLDDSDNDIYFGVSAGYDFNPQFGVGLAYDSYQVGDGSADFDYGVFSLTGEVRF